MSPSDSTLTAAIATAPPGRPGLLKRVWEATKSWWHRSLAGRCLAWLWRLAGPRIKAWWYLMTDIVAACRLAWPPIACSILVALVFLIPDQSRDAIRATLSVSTWLDWVYVAALLGSLLAWAITAHLWSRILLMHPHAWDSLNTGVELLRSKNPDLAEQRLNNRLGLVSILPKWIAISVLLAMATVVACIVVQLPSSSVCAWLLPVILLLVFMKDPTALRVDYRMLWVIFIGGVVVAGVWARSVGTISVVLAAGLLAAAYLALLALFKRGLWAGLCWLWAWLRGKPAEALGTPFKDRALRALKLTSDDWRLTTIVTAFFVPAFLFLASSAELSLLTRMSLYKEGAFHSQKENIDKYYTGNDLTAIFITLSNAHRPIDSVDGRGLALIPDSLDLAEQAAQARLRGPFWCAVVLLTGLAYLTLLIGRRLDRRLGWKEASKSDNAGQKQAKLPVLDWEKLRELHFIRIYVAGTALLVIGFLVWPVPLGQFLRAATVIALFAPVLIATLSLMSWVSRSIGVPLIPLAFAAWFGLGFAFDNHFVYSLQPRPDDKANSAASAKDKAADGPTVEDAFNHWYAAAKQRSGPVGKLPIVIVATAGGGVRAAYWTASVLGDLQDRDPSFRNQLFAISGVSGGSLGAAVFSAMLKQHDLTTSNPNESLSCKDSNGNEVKTYAACAQRVLDKDGMGPILGTMLFPDLLRRLTPLPRGWQPYSEWDRARVFETSWEDSWRNATGTQLLAGNFDDLWKSDNCKGDTCPAYPALLLNGTSVKSGRRIITSSLQLDDDFPDALDFFKASRLSIPVSTAVSNSARFPVIGPAGSFNVWASEKDDKQRGIIIGKEQVVDGGYFENYGATTALDLADAIRRHHKVDDLHFVFVQISSDPTLPLDPKRPEEDKTGDAQKDASLQQNGDTFAAGAIANELSAPVWALTATRTARGVFQAALARNRVEKDFGGTYVHFRLAVGCGHDAPLGWVLAEDGKDALKKSLNCKENSDQRKILADKGICTDAKCVAALTQPPPPDTKMAENAR